MKDRDGRLKEIDIKVARLMDRMTLEEMILQTDQYFTNDFVRRKSDAEPAELDMDKLDSLLRGNSCGSIQARCLTPEQVNEIQRYAVP